ncbi:hypothetical protein; putative Toll/Interleukin receptor TIR domain [Bradyrhizobium sp. ORS 278]|uniref:toll/interleukin-1 receptor domain-containing protein n=1 Tax=Bradyrhizobium sp. (strain ORS 278) TaxID=114615 RepID=UPI0001507B97|nr:toll/interleukin-1 receptor domain-containing protein [Bradyrhizobium sp. ORS 278]CAL76027.1 hypothetical protein; putative Toll/Interleukin receptor TIR domain [Bradyrhizobium sp. ORS 278]
MKVYISVVAKRLVTAALRLFSGRSMGGRKLAAINAAKPASAAAAAAGRLSASVHKLKAFISYSRTDLDFAERLVAALEARNIEVLIDKRDLPLLEEWQRELAGFIRKADAVIYLVSSASIGSRWCEWEIAQVIALNKRLAPIVVTTLADNEPIPDSIAKIDFLFFTPPNDFEAQADKLAKALGTDLSWLKDHTRLGEDAARWNEKGRPGAMLLGVGTAGETRVIALNSGTTVQRFTFDGTPRSLALSPNGAFMVVETKDDVLRLLQVTPPADLGSFRLTREEGALTLTGRAAIASNGQTIVAEARQTQARRVGFPSDLRVWNPPAETEARVVEIGGDRSGLATTSCALSDDAQWGRHQSPRGSTSAQHRQRTRPRDD